MSLTFGPDEAVIAGEGDLDDARALDAWLREDPSRVVNLEGCGHLHSAVVQVLLILCARLRGVPADFFVKQWLVPALRRHSGAP
jgi:anti-anti-sigma regulatory factor